MNIEKFVKETLKLNKIGTYSRDGSYVIDLDDSDDFGRAYSKLEKIDELDYEEEENLITVHNASIKYNYNDEAFVTLLADFDNDLYSIVIKEL